MQRKPTTDELFELIVRGSRIPLAEVKRHPDGALFPEQIAAAPKDPLCTAKLDIGNAAMMGELGEVADDPGGIPAAYPFLLIGRRMAHVYNSSGRDLPALAAKGGTFNPAFMHPAGPCRARRCRGRSRRDYLPPRQYPRDRRGGR